MGTRKEDDVEIKRVWVEPDFRGNHIATEMMHYLEIKAREFEKLSDIINQFHRQNKMIATVCVAAFALAHSGVLTGKKATTYHLNNWIRQKQLAEYGVEIVNEPVVKTDYIITSYCPQTAPYVAFALLEHLVGTKKMNIVKSAMGFA